MTATSPKAEVPTVVRPEANLPPLIAAAALAPSPPVATPTATLGTITEATSRISRVFGFLNLVISSQESSILAAPGMLPMTSMPKSIIPSSRADDLRIASSFSAVVSAAAALIAPATCLPTTGIVLAAVLAIGAIMSFFSVAKSIALSSRFLSSLGLSSAEAVLPSGPGRPSTTSGSSYMSGLLSS